MFHHSIPPFHRANAVLSPFYHRSIATCHHASRRRRELGTVGSLGILGLPAWTSSSVAGACNRLQLSYHHRERTASPYQKAPHPDTHSEHAKARIKEYHYRRQAWHGSAAACLMWESTGACRIQVRSRRCGRWLRCCVTRTLTFLFAYTTTSVWFSCC